MFVAKISQLYKKSLIVLSYSPSLFLFAIPFYHVQYIPFAFSHILCWILKSFIFFFKILKGKEKEGQKH